MRTCLQACTFRAYVPTRTHSYVYTHAHTHTHAHARTHARARMHTHARMHARTRTLGSSFLRLELVVTGIHSAQRLRASRRRPCVEREGEGEREKERGREREREKERVTARGNKQDRLRARERYRERERAIRESCARVCVCVCRCACACADLSDIVCLRRRSVGRLASPMPRGAALAASPRLADAAEAPPRAELLK